MRQALPPTAARCLRCAEGFAKHEIAIEMPYYKQGGMEITYSHRECAVRVVVGSVGHLRRTCSCFGGTEEDPAGMTKREAAKAACELWERLKDPKVN